MFTCVITVIQYFNVWRWNGIWKRFVTVIRNEQPVYIKNSEIQMDKNKKIGDFEMYESIHKKLEMKCFAYNWKEISREII